MDKLDRYRVSLFSLFSLFGLEQGDNYPDTGGSSWLMFREVSGSSNEPRFVAVTIE